MFANLSSSLPAPIPIPKFIFDLCAASLSCNRFFLPEEPPALNPPIPPIFNPLPPVNPKLKPMAGADGLPAFYSYNLKSFV